MTIKQQLISLDVGEKRIGVAIASSAVNIAIPYGTFLADGSELKQIAELAVRENVKTLVVGYPRNQQGEPTAQTRFVEQFCQQLTGMGFNVEFQDESLTSVMAEQQLKEQAKPYNKADIDARAATIILQDYLEQQRPRGG